MAVTNAQIWARLNIIDSTVQALLSHSTGLAHQLNALGGRMSEQNTELDQSVDAVKQAVADLSARLGNLPDQVAEIARLNEELTAARADDQADDAKIADLEGQLSNAISDAQENVGELQGVTEQIQGLGQPSPPVEPTPVDPGPDVVEDDGFIG